MSSDTQNSDLLDAPFEEELLNNIPKLRLYARALTGNKWSADDLVQESLLRAMEKNHLWERGTNLGAWLVTIMRHQFIDTCRNRKPVSLADLHEDQLPPLSAEADQPLRLECKRTEQAINTLCLEYREVLTLIAIEGVSYEEAANIIGVPIGTIRSRLSRARATLRDVLESERRYPKQPTTRKKSRRTGSVKAPPPASRRKSVVVAFAP